MFHSVELVALVEILECLWSLCLQVGHQTINSMMHVAHQYLSFVKLSQSFNPPESIIFSLVQSCKGSCRWCLNAPTSSFTLNDENAQSCGMHSCDPYWTLLWNLHIQAQEFFYKSLTHFPSSDCLFKHTDCVSTPINLLIKHIYMITFTSWQ